MRNTKSILQDSRDTAKVSLNGHEEIHSNSLKVEYLCRVFKGFQYLSYHTDDAYYGLDKEN